MLNLSPELVQQATQALSRFRMQAVEEHAGDGLVPDRMEAIVTGELTNIPPLVREMCVNRPSEKTRGKGTLERRGNEWALRFTIRGFGHFVRKLEEYEDRHHNSQTDEEMMRSAEAYPDPRTYLQ